MITYVNSFFCATSAEKSEVLIKFYQNIPQSEVDNSNESTVSEEVAQIIMNGKCARMLIDHITELLDDDSDVKN